MRQSGVVPIYRARHLKELLEVQKMLKTLPMINNLNIEQYLKHADRDRPGERWDLQEQHAVSGKSNVWDEITSFAFNHINL